MTTPATPSVTKFKRGVTFKPTCRLPVTGSLTNLTGVQIASSITTTDGKEWVATVNILDNRSWTLLISETVTAKWPIGDAYWDIKFKLNGVVVATETVILRIVKNATSTQL
jgi:hypothetical protein